MKRAALLGAFQIVFMLGWSGYHEHVRANAPTFRIPLGPVDPYDVLRGRYFILNPLDGQVRTGDPGVLLTAAAVAVFTGGEQHVRRAALIGFCPAGDVYRVCALRRLDDPSREGATYWSRAFVTVSPNGQGWIVTIAMRLDRFFLPNRFQLPGPERDPNWELEVSYRPAQPLLPRRLWFKGQPVSIG